MKTLNIELLALDFAVCDRCGGTLVNLREALQATRPALAALGIEAVLTETLVTSEAHAEELHFASSPTIRIDGQDLTGTIRETACSECTELSGSEEDIECRVWPWRGQTFDAAPRGQIVEAILSVALATEGRPKLRGWKGVPANITAYLRAKARKAACCDRQSAICCAPSTSEPCCEPACCQ
jgi:hypothetical protein